MQNSIANFSLLRASSTKDIVLYFLQNLVPIYTEVFMYGNKVLSLLSGLVGGSVHRSWQ